MSLLVLSSLEAYTQTDNKVGINKPTPQQTLDVKGKVRLKRPGTSVGGSKLLAITQSGKVITKDYPRTGRIFVQNIDFPTTTKSYVINQPIRDTDGQQYHANNNTLWLINARLVENVPGASNEVPAYIRAVAPVATRAVDSRQHYIRPVRIISNYIESAVGDGRILSGILNNAINDNTRRDLRTPLMMPVTLNSTTGGFVGGNYKSRSDWSASLGAYYAVNSNNRTMIWKTQMLVIDNSLEAVSWAHGGSYYKDNVTGRVYDTRVSTRSVALTIEGGDSKTIHRTDTGLSRGN